MLQLLLPSPKPGAMKRVFEKIALALGPRPRAVERRVQRRIPVHGSARMIVEGGKSDRPAVVNMLDISQTGIAVRASFAVEVGRPILISDGNLVIAGIVRHCSGEGKEFSIGIEIQPSDNLIAPESPYLLLSA